MRQAVTILNLSRSGAMVEMPVGASIPDRHVLLYLNQLQPCATVWRDGCYAGVRFVSS